MEKLNVNLDLQIKLNFHPEVQILATYQKRMIVLIRKNKLTYYVEVDKDGNVGEATQCELTTDLDQAGKWFRVVGTGAMNKTNIKKALRMINKASKE